MSPRATVAALAAFAAFAAFAALSLVAAPAERAGAQAPPTVTIGTVPPIAGVGLSVDGQTVRTGADGAVTVTVVDRRGVGQRLQVLDLELELEPGVRARFSRVFGASGDSVRVAYDIDYLVGFAYRPRTGAAFAAADIDMTRLRSAMGAVIELSEAEGPVWLHGTRVISSPDGPVEREIQWSIDDVVVGGASVVYRSATRFLPRSNRAVELELLYFTASFTVRDALLGGAVSSGELELIYPNGEVHREPIAPDGSVVFASLPRGEYTVTVRGSGPNIPRPVSITRDQTMDLRFYTWIDVGMAGFAGLVFLAVPAAIGLRRRRRLRPSPAVAAAAIALGACLLLPAPPAGAAPAQTVRPPDEPLVLAHYYIWFDAGSWNRAKKDYPALGRYSSDEASTMRKHVEMARAAGIDGFIVSWKSTPDLDHRLETLIGIAEEEQFLLAVTYQGLDFARTPLPAAQVAADLDRFAALYATRAPFGIFERPLVALTGTWERDVHDLAAIVDGRRSRLLILATAKDLADYERVAGLVDGNLYYWSSVDPVTHRDYPAKLVELGDAVHRRGGRWVAPAAPGFDATLLGGERAVPRRDGATLRAAWAGAVASAPDAVGVISWNEFSENTHIEPSENHGSRSLETVARLTGEPTPQPFLFDSDSDAGGSDDGPARVAALAALVGLGAVATATLGWRRRG